MEKTVRSLLFVVMIATALYARAQTDAAGGNYLVMQVEPGYALVFIDGQPQTVTDGISTTFLVCGRHKYKVQAPAHALQEGFIEITAGQPVVKRVSLLPEQPNMQISSTTSGTAIYINGEYRGVDTWRGTLSAGTYTVEGRKDGFQQYAETLTLGNRENVALQIPALQPQHGTVKVDYRPAGARVSVDGLYKGTTPIEIKDLPAGAHKVEVSADGYLTRACQVDLLSGRTSTLHGSLERLKQKPVEVAKVEPKPAPAQKTVAKEAKPDKSATKDVAEKKQPAAAKADDKQKETADAEIKADDDKPKKVIGTRTVIGAADGMATRRNVIPVNANGIVFNMVLVDGGQFDMGATPEQGIDAEPNEEPAHSVTLDSFYMCETEVTQDLWAAVMGYNPSAFKGGNLPVDRVSWEETQDFLVRLSQLTGMTFRLPTEAEWEYAARGGKKARGYRYSSGNDINAAGWYIDNSSLKTHPVKDKTANELCLYDMSGNVMEWCADWYGLYTAEDANNPKGPETGTMRVCRGGYKSGGARACRVSAREYAAPRSSSYNIGLRLAM